jgi:ferredoxin-thioredoxin reductase catalytic subunit
VKIMDRRKLAKDIVRGLELAFDKLPEEAVDVVVEILMENNVQRGVDVCPVCRGTRQDPAYSQLPANCPACGGTGVAADASR